MPKSNKSDKKSTTRGRSPARSSSSSDKPKRSSSSKRSTSTSPGGTHVSSGTLRVLRTDKGLRITRVCECTNKKTNETSTRLSPGVTLTDKEFAALLKLDPKKIIGPTPSSASKKKKDDDNDSSSASGSDNDSDSDGGKPAKKSSKKPAKKSPKKSKQLDSDSDSGEDSDS